MMEHKKFSYKHPDELREDILKAGVDLPMSGNTDILKTQLELDGMILSNRMVIHPMEGCDGTAEGAPGELTTRRYNRFGSGGAGLLWVEACAVINGGRANPHQLFLDAGTQPVFKKMFDEMLSGREGQPPYTVIQLTHSGRYSKPDMNSEAIVAVEENPYLDPFTNPARRVISDDELEALEGRYVEAAKMAKAIGFNAVDVKACHRYLISELLSAHTRKGRYGGSFENRTRFLLNIIDRIRASVDIGITLRMNAYDAIPYPYGWGTGENREPAPDEPRRLMKILQDKGIRLVNLTTGNPYYNPHIGRPSDTAPYVAPEHPIESASRMLNIIRELKESAPQVAVIGTGFSWFREYGALIAAGCIEKGWMDLAGFGRQSFAYPGFANDIMTTGEMDRKKCCIACTKCTELMRFGREAGCVIRDSKIYLPVWRAATNGRTMMSTRQGIHI